MMIDALNESHRTTANAFLRACAVHATDFTHEPARSLGEYLAGVSALLDAGIAEVREATSEAVAGSLLRGRRSPQSAHLRAFQFARDVAFILHRASENNRPADYVKSRKWIAEQLTAMEAIGREETLNEMIGELADAKGDDSIEWVRQSDVAARMGVSRKSVSEWVKLELLETNGESGRDCRINKASAVRFAEAAGRAWNDV